MGTVKEGRFFSIPERPGDLRDIWNRAQPLQKGRLPAWLTWEDAADYRCVDCVLTEGLTEADDAALLAEIEELELARLIVDKDDDNPDKPRVYIKRPSDEAIWSIGIYQGRSPLELAPASIAQPVLTADSVTDVAASFVADPFLLVRDGRWHMFFEVMNWRANKGEIGLATSDDGLIWRYERIVLAEDFHLSYPHVLEGDDGIYMVPESFQAGAVRLYRAVRFPYQWQCVGELLTGGYYADSTPFQYEGSWWMFTETGQATDDTLRLFYADHLRGPWHEHPKSPIIAGNARLSRPAGRVQVGQTAILRFSQDCDGEYGTAVRAIEIARLSRNDYQEVASEMPILGPSGRGWNAGGMHHVDAIRHKNEAWLAAVDGWTKPDFNVNP
jgi:hypothetical protein